MPVELAGISLTSLTDVGLRERARIARHPVPGMDGDLTQTLGRPSVEVYFKGIFYGQNVAQDLAQLRQAYLARQPVDFFTEAVGESYFSRVLISRLEVTQRAAYVDQFDFLCEVIEYVEPPPPVAADPLAALDGDLLGEASGFLDDVQNALAQVSELTNLLANIPSFADPTTRLPETVTAYKGLVGGGVGVLGAIRDLF